MRLEHHLVGGYVRYISPHIIIIIAVLPSGSSEVTAVSLGSFSTRNINTLLISDSLEYRKVWYPHLTLVTNSL